MSNAAVPPRSRGITRRACAAFFAASPLLAAAPFGQIAATPQNPPPLSAPEKNTAAQDLAKAVADVKSLSDRLSQLNVPMTVEPAFTFHV